MRTILMVGTIGFLSVSAVHALRDRTRRAPDPPTAMAMQSVPAVPIPSGPPSAVALQADRKGHFFARAAIDGHSLPMMVDTGATLCTFSEEDAAQIGIKVGPGDYTGTTQTANGLVRVARVRVGSIRIGSIVVRDVEAIVVPRGRLGTALLGMSFLGRVREFAVAGGTLTLRG